MPFENNSWTLSSSALPTNISSGYAPSMYAASTLAASTVMPSVLMQPVKDNENTKWAEGHCMVWRPRETGTCTICDEKCDDGCFGCTGRSPNETYPTSTNVRL